MYRLGLGRERHPQPFDPGGRVAVLGARSNPRRGGREVTPLLSIMVRALLTHKNAVDVSGSAFAGSATVLRVRVDPKDTGKIIGK